MNTICPSQKKETSLQQNLSILCFPYEKYALYSQKQPDTQAFTFLHLKHRLPLLGEKV